jgi:hypothetical protein
MVFVFSGSGCNGNKNGNKAIYKTALLNPYQTTNLEHSWQA